MRETAERKKVQLRTPRINITTWSRGDATRRACVVSRVDLSSIQTFNEQRSSARVASRRLSSATELELERSRRSQSLALATELELERSRRSQSLALAMSSREAAVTSPLERDRVGSAVIACSIRELNFISRRAHVFRDHFAYAKCGEHFASLSQSFFCNVL